MAFKPYSKPLGLVRSEEQAKEHNLFFNYSGYEPFCEKLSTSGAPDGKNGTFQEFKPLFKPPHSTAGATELVAVTSTNKRLNAARRKRTNFTAYQLQELEMIFRRSQYISPSVRSDLAAKLDLRADTVQTWFKNRRVKWRNERREQTAMTGAKFPACMSGASGRYCILPLTTMPPVLHGRPHSLSLPNSSLITARLADRIVLRH